MSTGWAARLVLVLAVGAAAAGCAGRGSTSPTGGEALTLFAVQPTVQLAPGQQGSIAFRLVNGGVPAVKQTVTFALLTPMSSDPGAANSDPRGATLAAMTAATDGSGTAVAVVRAGLATTFKVQAQIGATTQLATVIVEDGTTGTVQVAPFFTSAAAPQKTTSLRVLFYDDTSCADIDADAPPAPARDPVVIAIGDSAVAFPFVSTVTTSAVLAQALGLGPTVVAAGCVDVPGSTVLAGSTVQVSVPLADAVPNPVGTFAVTSTMTLAPPLAASAALAAPWQALSACPLDPAQIWLDCTIDALATPATGDPLDCAPATAAGAEGPVGDALLAHRGAWLKDGSGATLACRAARDPQGHESVDAIVQGLFGTPTPPPVVALPAIAADAAALLSSVRLTSALAVAPGSQPGSYVLTHTLQSALFGQGGAVEVPLAPLGFPVLQAVTSAALTGGSLQIASHGFTLRLGSAARAAFGPLALAPRGFPPDAAGFVAALFAAATRADGSTACAALDATVCPEVGQAAGCVRDACAAGLAALAKRLDAGFSAGDGAGLDLQLSGKAPLVAVPGILQTQRLGVGETQSGMGALWTASVRTALDDITVVVPFDGIRN